MGNGTTVEGIQSMTGFASHQGSYDSWSWTVELRSVNGRGLELRMRVPDWIEGLEIECRKRLQAVLKRGNVNLIVRIQRDEERTAARINAQGLTETLSMLASIETAAHDAGVAVSTIRATDIAAIKGVLDWGETETDLNPELKKQVLSGFDKCLTAFCQDRAREGNALSAVLTENVNTISILGAQASDIIGEREKHQRSALEKSLSRILDSSEMPDESRLLQEMAIIAIKTDVTEEIDRLNAHVAAAHELLETNGAIGRKFDFLMQEFNREANTLCSKSQSTELTAVGLELQAVIDQLREQVQNVE